MHSNEINSICWSKQDRFIAAGSSNGGIAILNQINNQISKQLFFSNEKTVKERERDKGSYSNIFIQIPSPVLHYSPIQRIMQLI